jgi:Tfp pilus assembly protein PilX
MQLATLKRQRGVTLGGVFFFMLLVGFAAYIAARVLPAYMDYWTIQRVMQNIVDQPDIQNTKESAIRTKFNKELQMNNMTTVSNDDLIVDPVPNGFRLSVSFSIKKPFMGPISLCMDFQAQATSK